MPQSFIVTLDDHASEEDLQSAKDTARNQGGKITNEYTIIKGFSVEFPDGTVHALDSIPCVKNVEADQIVTTQ
ncbi:Proteinase inhibitor, propeptide [Drechslerella dactyloides]|uniref:Proteinase inhibitor, propeptide n=1 Tax=Drechslerella dactyloides TaxID=74499 RepID=A0AAD6NG53_DREDA|nr:Proteinase inhibitor, propeptide [Drechslerella dactyloides]